MAENNSKDLLRLEANCAAVSTSSSCLESKLFVCKKEGTFSASGSPPTMPPLPKSQVLGKDNPNNYDIEVLSGKESEYIEMDLMLGIADLHTPEAVAAAESALAGYRQPLSLPDSSSGSENDNSSDEDGDDDDNTKEQVDEADSQSVSCKASKKQKLEKWSKIVELP